MKEVSDVDNRSTSAKSLIPPPQVERAGSRAKATESVLVGAAFQLMRCAVDLTQREVAQEVGISPSQLGRIERGEATAWGDQYSRLVDFFATALADRSWRLRRGTDLSLVN